MMFVFSNVIVVVRFHSSDYRSFSHLRTINARSNSLPILRLLSKTLFKVSSLWPVKGIRPNSV